VSFLTAHQAHRLLPPEDRHHTVYLSLLLSGAGFLLPYNCLLSAVDFLQAAFPGSTIIFDISLVYILTALLAVLLNTVIMHTFSLASRMLTGYLVSLLVLVFLLTALVWLEALPGEPGQAAVLARWVAAIPSRPRSVALVSLGSTVQQSSYYGLTSTLPARYTQVPSPRPPSGQAVMAGESLAGVAAVLARVLTKALLPSPRAATALLFLLSILVLVACIFCFLRVGVPDRSRLSLARRCRATPSSCSTGASAGSRAGRCARVLRGTRPCWSMVRMVGRRPRGCWSMVGRTPMVGRTRPTGSWPGPTSSCPSSGRAAGLWRRAGPTGWRTR
jgi:solute carrier family 29 (equilibrative nucleoside transporter) protein 4